MPKDTNAAFKKGFRAVGAPKRQTYTRRQLNRDGPARAFLNDKPVAESLPRRLLRQAETEG